MEEEYAIWKKNPTPESMGNLLNKAQPVLKSALTSYAAGNQLMSGKAKSLAINAFKTYDPKKGTKLQTHLMTQLQPLTRAHREYSQLGHVPERVSLDLYKLNQETQKFFDSYKREPSDKELTDVTGLSMKRIAHVRKFSNPTMPESGLTFTNEDGEEETLYPGTDEVDPQRVWIEYVHHDLSPIDQKILEWKTGLYGKEMLGTNEIAKRLNITAGAVSQRTSKITKRIGEGQGMA